MSLRYAGFPAKFNGSGLVLDQHGSAGCSPGQSFEEFAPTGSIDRLANVMAAASPSCRIQTNDAATVFGVVSPTAGYSCTSASIFRYRRRLAGGVFDTGSVDVLATANLGFMCIDSISARQDQVATVDLNFWPLFDGTNEPIIFSNSNASSGATSPAYNSSFFFGPVYLNGSLLAGCIGSAVSFGKAFAPYRFDGSVYAVSGAIIARRPTFSLTFNKLDHIATSIASTFHGAIGSTLAVYYWKGSAGGTRVAVGTASHLKISCATGSWGPRDIDYQENTDGTVTIHVMPTNTIATSVASTIP